MSTTQTSQKGTDGNWNDHVDTITTEVIDRLEDEPGDGCRFAAVAKRKCKIGPSYGLHFPVTRVLYVDGEGRYGFERVFLGVREDWQNVPRTVAVGGDEDVPRLGPIRERDVQSLLELYDGITIDP